MVDIKAEYYKQLVNVLKENYTKRFFLFDAFNTKEEAKNFVLSKINKDNIITYGGSMTLTQTGILPALQDGYPNFVNKPSAEIAREEKYQTYNSDIFLTGANAITRDGEIVLIDYIGNRASAILYGPLKVFVVIGINKVLPTLEDAMSYAKNITAPKQAINLGINNYLDTCSYNVVINKSYTKDRIHIVLVNDVLGF